MACRRYNLFVICLSIDNVDLSSPIPLLLALALFPLCPLPLPPSIDRVQVYLFRVEREQTNRCVNSDAKSKVKSKSIADGAQKVNNNNNNNNNFGVECNPNRIVGASSASTYITPLSLSPFLHTRHTQSFIGHRPQLTFVFV